jgi:hypothetical protein
MLRFIWSELRKPYGFHSMIMALAFLLLIGGLLYKASVWLSSLPAAWGWV